jgi:hypothetical protein
MARSQFNVGSKDTEETLVPGDVMDIMLGYSNLDNINNHAELPLESTLYNSRLQKLKHLLTAIVSGDLDKTKAMLEEDPSLLLEKLEENDYVVSPSGKKSNYGTAYLTALLAVENIQMASRIPDIIKTKLKEIKEEEAANAQCYEILADAFLKKFPFIESRYYNGTPFHHFLSYYIFEDLARFEKKEIRLHIKHEYALEIQKLRYIIIEKKWEYLKSKIESIKDLDTLRSKHHENWIKEYDALDLKKIASMLHSADDYAILQKCFKDKGKIGEILTLVSLPQIKNIFQNLDNFPPEIFEVFYNKHPELFIDKASERKVEVKQEIIVPKNPVSALPFSLFTPVPAPTAVEKIKAPEVKPSAVSAIPFSLIQRPVLPTPVAEPSVKQQAEEMAKMVNVGCVLL